MRNITTLLLLILLPWGLAAQIKIELNANLDAELSRAGDRSHFYYNEIDKYLTDWHFDLSQANLIGRLHFSDQWKINSRLLMQRKMGKDFEELLIPQLNLQFFPNDKNYSFTVGRFINPFGSFNKKQLSTQRTFISMPLAYAYYHNISNKIGLMRGLGDDYQIQIDGQVEWGTTNVYYGGYASGLMFKLWARERPTLNWSIALVNGSAGGRHNFSRPQNLGIVSRMQWHPTYFWKQGFSLSFGQFMVSSEANEDLSGLNPYHQLLIGTDYEFGAGFFSLSGELMASFYRVPVFDPESMTFEEESQRVGNFSSYLDLRYEPPFFSGSFIAYRFDALLFGKIDPSLYQGESWDNNVVRHSLGLGYKAFPFLLLRAFVSTQNVKDRPQWSTGQRTFRLMMTLHY